MDRYLSDKRLWRNAIKTIIPAMDLLSKDEPLINLNGFDSAEESGDLLSEEFQPLHQRRLSSSKHASLNNRQHRPHSGSKAYLRELSPVLKEQSMERNTSAIVSAVERTMKNYADGVLRVLEGMSGRLSQLESISQELENSVTNIRNLVEENYEHTDRNFRILNERTMEMHRSVQIIRDKQDIIEAHAQLEKLQNSKALAEKESSPGLANTEPQEPTKGYQQKDHTLQEQSQKLSAQLVASPSVMPQTSLSPQPVKSLPQPLAPHYQIPNSQSQQLIPLQLVPHHETSGHSTQQISTAHVTPSEQVQYQSVPQQLQVQPMHPPPPPPAMLQPQQALEQGCYLPMQQPPLQQGPLQPQLQGAIIPQAEHAHYHSAPQQREIQVPSSPISVPQSVQAQQGMVTQQQIQAQQGIVPQRAVQAQQGPVSQQPPHLQQQSPSRLQGSYQYHGQPNDGQSYSSFTPVKASYAPSAYSSEIARDAANFAPHHHHNPTHQSSPLPPMQSFHHMNLTSPQAAQSSHDSVAVGNVSGPMTWNRQTGLSATSPAPRLPTAQPVRVEHSPEVSGIVEKVVSMGFSRDQVQSVIRMLAERNPSVDMNMVLDILMNRSTAMQGGFVR